MSSGGASTGGASASPPAAATASGQQAAPLTTPSKLKPTAAVFNPNARSFTPASASAAPSSVASPAAAPSKPLSASSSSFKPLSALRSAAKEYSPQQPAYNPAYVQQQQQQFQPAMRMQMSPGFPMQGMPIMGPNGPYFPQMYAAPNAFYPQQAFVPQQYMAPNGIMMAPNGMPMHPQQMMPQQPIATQPAPQQTAAAAAATPAAAPTPAQAVAQPKPAAAAAATAAPLLSSPAQPASTATVTVAPVAATPEVAPVAPVAAAAAPVAAVAPTAVVPPAATATAVSSEEKPVDVKVSSPSLSAEKSGAAAAQSFGVKPVERYKAKPASERKREPKKPEDEEQDLKDARQRSTSIAAADEEKSAVAQPAAVAASPSPSSEPAAADAESSLASAISAATGPFQYSREYLLQFKAANNGPVANLPTAIEKGSGDAVVTADRPGTGLRPGSRQQPGAGQSSRIGNSNRSVPPVPNSGAPIRAGFGTAAQPPRQPGRNGAQGGNRRNRVDAPMDIEIVPLAQSENRYKPLKDLPANVELLRAVNSILNKLTPEKFDTLVDKVIDLKIDSAALLRDVVTSVFEKALAEPNYSPVYAEFCVKLSARLPSFPANENDTQNTHNFKRLILNQCQQEFENQDGAVSESGELAPGRVTLAAFEAMNDEEKNEHLAKLKRRTLGTIRFIGELFVRAMLAAKIMRNCIALLVGDAEAPNEENMEALCKLLETVGKLLDNKAQPANHDFLNNVFLELERLAQPPSAANRDRTEAGRPVLSSRLRFMILDTIDMRKKDWVQRRKNEVNAKKISDVHKESAAPPQQDARGSSAARPVAPVSVSASRYGKKQDRYAVGAASPSPRSGVKQADDGWETAKSGKRSQDVRGVGLSRASSGNAVSAATTPSNRSGQQTPQKASFRSAADKAEKKEDGKNNAFALLNGDEEDDSAANEARSASSQRDEDEEEEESQADADEAAEEEVVALNLSADEILSRTKSFMKEYFTSDDFNEVELCIKEIGGAAALSEVSVSEGLMVAIEGKDRDRAGFAKLLPLLVSRNYLSREQIESGFLTILEMSEDMGVDYPRLIEQVAGIYAHLIHESVVPITTLTKLSPVITDSGDQVKFATFVLSNLKKSKDADFVQFVRDADIKWNDIAGESLNADQTKKLLNDKVRHDETEATRVARQRWGLRGWGRIRIRTET